MRARADSGVGLIELLVVMSLLTVALTMFGLAFSATLRTTDASEDLGAVTDQARLALAQLDRQVRFGYWVNSADVPCAAGTCSAVKVLTLDAAGTRECWLWAIDPGGGGLMSFHYPAVGVQPTVPLLGATGWFVAGGREGDVGDDVSVDASASMLGVSNLVRPLNIANLTRASYYTTLGATLKIQKPNRPPVTLDMKVSVRNQWAGAAYAGECP